MMKITKTVLSKILWLGKGTATTMGVAVMLAVVLGAGTTALAAVPGDPFKLGVTNTINEITRLVGSADSAMLRIDNDGSGTALDLRVASGEAPMTVNSSTKVEGLNADEVDGKSADAFLGSNDKASDAAHADTADHADKAAGAAFADQAELADKADDATHAVQADRAARAANASKVDGLSADEIGVNNWSRVVSGSDFDSDSPKTITAHCPSGKVVVGTGYDTSGARDGASGNEETDVVVDQVAPLKTNVEVVASEETHTSANWSVWAFAVCAQAP